MTRYIILAMLFILLALPGCKSTSIDLDPQWAPLEKMVASKTMTAGLSSRGARTVGNTVYVRDIDHWMATHPEPLFTGVMRHEQVHARRQLAYGLYKWLSRYLTDRDFMWREEQLGWYEWIVYVRARGVIINPEGLAETLHGYMNLTGHMVSEADALAWVNDVIAGRWRPTE